MYHYITDIIRQYKEEAKIRSSVSWGFSYEDDGKHVVICTNKPGCFIGLRGERVERLKNDLKKYNIVQVDFIETHGLIV